MSVPAAGATGAAPAPSSSASPTEAHADADRTPRVLLLDARVEGLAREAELRARARAASAGAPPALSTPSMPPAPSAPPTPSMLSTPPMSPALSAPPAPPLFTSRAYSWPFALVAWHTAAVGIDIERVAPCDEAFADSIRTPSERLAGWPAGEDSDRFFTSLWSSKEALAKALGDALRYDPRRLEGPGAWPDGRAGPWRARALELGSEHVGWLCWRAAGGAAPQAPAARSGRRRR